LVRRVDCSPRNFRAREREVGFDAGTLVTALVVVSVVLSALLALTWFQNRSVPAFGIWTLCFMLATAAAVIVGLREKFPGDVGLDIANALRLLAFGLAWQGARYFTGRKGSWAVAVAPLVLWSAASALDLFGENIRLRALFTAPLVAAYSFAIARELWRVGWRRFGVAPLATVLMAFHGSVFVARFFVALLMPESAVAVDIGIAAPLHPIGVLETLAAGVATAFLLLSVTKEAIGEEHRAAALRDPLTGASNRRGFEEEVERMLAHAARTNAWTALVLIDLDRFKGVNDSFGHPAGDRLLKALTEVIGCLIRKGDVVGRLGGDEFAVALNECRVDQALLLAERVRRAVASLKLDGAVSFTVSVGVASLHEAGSLEELFREADAALYRAKARGGNRVEFAAAEPAAAKPREVHIRRVA
jgi:diguanylate cyclase (GGDEF)-like protein